MTDLPNTTTGPHQLENTEEACRYGLRVLHLHRCIKNSLIYEVPACINDTQMIGDCSIGAFSYAAGSESQIHDTDIGRYTSIGPGVTIGTAEHPTGWLSTHPFQYDGTRLLSSYAEYHAIVPTTPLPHRSRGRQRIGNDVWIGDGALILNDVTIGDGAIIAGRSVVTSDVPPFTVVAGVPARPLRDRFPPALAERLARLKWWNYDLSPLRDVLPFDRPATAADDIEDAIERGDLKPLEPPTVRLEYQQGKWFIRVLTAGGENAGAHA